MKGAPDAPGVSIQDCVGCAAATMSRHTMRYTKHTLARNRAPPGVVAGAVAGHGVATGIAVAGGGLLSNYISERSAQYIGGSLFLVFAAATVYDLATGAHGG